MIYLCKFIFVQQRPRSIIPIVESDSVLEASSSDDKKTAKEICSN